MFTLQTNRIVLFGVDSNSSNSLETAQNLFVDDEEQRVYNISNEQKGELGSFKVLRTLSFKHHPI